MVNAITYNSTVNRARIAEIEKLIRPHVRRTPVVEADGLALKLELMQYSGSFKAGERYADALAASEKWAAESGALQVHAFDQEPALLGQGTVGLELEEQAPQLDTLLVAVGGGGLMFPLAQKYVERVVLVEDDDIPTAQRQLWDSSRIVSEPGGAAARGGFFPLKTEWVPAFAGTTADQRPSLACSHSWKCTSASSIGDW